MQVRRADKLVSDLMSFARSLRAVPMGLPLMTWLEQQACTSQLLLLIYSRSECPAPCLLPSVTVCLMEEGVLLHFEMDSCECHSI